VTPEQISEQLDEALVHLRAISATLAGLLKRCARCLPPEHTTRKLATDYLRQQGYLSPLRTAGVDVPAPADPLNPRCIECNKPVTKPGYTCFACVKKRSAGVQATGEAERIAELEAEVAHVRRWYGDRLEILSAWAREHLMGEQLHTFFNIAANARPHHTDEPEWFRAVIARLAARGVNGLDGSDAK
jgi:hypothetical protein